MLTIERHAAILQLLAARGRLTIGEIVAQFNVSASTARRDAAELAEAGKAVRSHGGLLPVGFFDGQSSLRDRAERASTPETEIARRVAELLPDEGNVFIDSGSTCAAVGRLIGERRNLRIFTNSVPLVALAAECNATLTSIAGKVNHRLAGTVGPLALNWLGRLHFDAAVLGAVALDEANGPSALDADDAAIKTDVMRRSDYCVLAAEASLWGRPAATRFADWHAFDAFVTDPRLPRAVRIALAADSVKVVLA